MLFFIIVVAIVIIGFVYVFTHTPENKGGNSSKPVEAPTIKSSIAPTTTPPH